MLPKMIVGIIAVLTLVLTSLVGPATAATQASIISDGLRVDVTFTGKKPTKARMVVGGTSYKLTRSGNTWRTKVLTAQTIARLTGKRAKLKITVGGKNRTLKATVRATTTTPVDPAAVPPTGTAPLFMAPGVDRDGDAAWQAIKGYFANSTLSDCADPRGWPYCQVEERYGFFDDGTQWYCYLTPNGRSDVKSVSNIQQLLFAQQKADGAWRVDYRSVEYGKLVYYSVNVAANGTAVVNYWKSGADPNGAPSTQYSGLQWFRGAKDCSY